MITYNYLNDIEVPFFC